MILESLFAQASSRPEQLAIIDDRGQFTYKQLAAISLGLARHLSQQTHRPRVGLLLPASASYVASFYGILAAGKSVVPVNFLLSETQIAHIIADSGIDTVLSITPLVGRLQNTGLKIIDLAQLPLLPQEPLATDLPTPRSNDLAVLMYTSGTSAQPKGVMLSYGNLQSDVDACIQHAGLKTQHRFLGIIPLFHAFGMTAMMLAPIQLGSTIVYLPRFSAAAALDAIKTHNISLVFGVPSMFAAIAHLKNAGPQDFKNIYAIISGGEPLPKALYDTFLSRFGIPIYEGYGLTETSPVVSLNTPQNHRPGSVGKLLPTVTAKIVDDNGLALPPGQIGEIWLKGPMIMMGYHNLPDQTAAAITPDGFFKTGDLGMLDTDGYLYITGRKKDMIIVSGEKVYPREIEDVLLQHPAVVDAAVLGKKDPNRGEVVVAFVATGKDQTIQPETLREFCRQQGLPVWKCPREIHILDELPRSPTGKVLKRLLADRIVQS